MKQKSQIKGIPKSGFVIESREVKVPKLLKKPKIGKTSDSGGAGSRGDGEDT